MHWLLRQWRDISGNVKFWLLTIIVTLIVMPGVKILAGRLDWWQQLALSGTFVLVSTGIALLFLHFGKGIGRVDGARAAVRVLAPAARVRIHFRGGNADLVPLD